MGPETAEMAAAVTPSKEANEYITSNATTIATLNPYAQNCKHPPMSKQSENQGQLGQTPNLTTTLTTPQANTGNSGMPASIQDLLSH
jgi:hypothetical protein